MSENHTVQPHPDVSNLEARLEVRFASVQQRLEDRLARLDEKMTTVIEKMGDNRSMIMEELASTRCPVPGRCLILQETIVAMQKTMAEFADWKNKEVEPRITTLERLRWQLVGIVGILTFVGPTLGSVLLEYFTKHH